MSLDLQTIETARVYQDWKIDLDRPEEAVVFPGPSKVPDELIEFARVLAMAVDEQSKKAANPKSFVVFVPGAEDFGFRVTRQPTTRARRYSLRILNKDAPKLEELGFKESYRKLMLNPELRRTGGLILISGVAGSGKTTTASSIVSQRLTQLGGFALTAEDPPEYSLEGFHPGEGETQGYCEQTEIVGDPHEHLRELLRCFPARECAMLFYGEVRDSRGAAELLRISLDGHLVIATIHASDIPDTLHRIIALAVKDGEVDAASMLGKSLKFVLHQRLDNGALQVSALENTQVVKSTIQRGDIQNGLTEELRLAQKRYSGPSMG